MRVTRTLAISGVLLLSILALAQSLCGQTYEGHELVKAELIADTNAVVPGKSFTVGLHLRMAPHWHTYWKFSGDAGLPTEIKWELPPRWKVGEIQWPIPSKTNDPGDIQTYGYQDEVLLLQEITPSASFSDEAAKLSANATWLVCEKICIPGSAQLKLELPRASSAEAATAAKSTTSSPANAELFARYRRLLPQKWPEAKVGSLNWERQPSALLLHVTSAAVAKSPFVDFYPLPPPNVVTGHPKVASHSENDITFRIPLETTDAKISSLAGLIVFGQSADDSNRGAVEIGNTPEVATHVSAAAVTHSVWTFLFFGFIGGFILNLMPCVLPVISLKIFGFIQQAGQSRQKILRSGIAFTAGIFAWFIALALILIGLKMAGRDATWGGFQFTNAYFVLGLSIIVLVFALNLFGVFEISLPQSMTRGLLATSDRRDNLGSFFQGVFATVLATPCTAPFLGTALGFAFTQSASIILLMFVAVAAGMSAPYLLLSAQPAWLRFLPKPGPWMVHVKQFMGFLLLATLLFLLYVLGAQRGLDGAIWASCFLLIIAVACWLKGAFIVPTASIAKRTVSLMLLLLLFSGLYFIGDKFQSARLETAQTNLPGDWQPFTPERLQSELDQGHAVFVDFTAAWCLTCKFNEKAVLENSAVRDSFQRRGIVKLRADWTNGDPVITKLLQQFGRPGVPLYVLYPNKSEEPIVFPELLTKSILLDKLETITPTVASE